MARNNYINILLISGGGIIGGFINYAYHPIMLKYLTLEEFGVFGSLVGMFNILGIITLGFILFLNKEISKNIENKEKIKFIFMKSTLLFLGIGIFSYLFYFLFSSFIANFLHINNISLIYIVGLSIILAFLSVSINATLRGLKKFEFLSIISILGPIVKLTSGFLLVFLGYKVFGAIIGFLLGGIFSLIISYIYLLKNLKKYEIKGNIKDLLLDFKKSRFEIGNFFFASFFFAIFMNIDLILVKNIFDEKTAGIYAGIAVLGKFLIFLLLSIETVYYSQIMEYKKENLPINLIKNPIILLVVISIIAILFNFFFGAFILGILKGELKEYVNIYLLTLVYYSFLAFISFFSKILIGWGKKSVNYIMFFLSILLIIFVYLFGNNLENFVYSFIFIGFLGTVIIGIYFYRVCFVGESKKAK